MILNRSIVVRDAEAGDVPVILDLIKELAAFENLSEAIRIDEARLREHGFGPAPRFRVLLAEDAEGAVGYLSYMIRYSIWGGGEFINLDDLYVRERARGLGAGRALMRRMAEIAAAQEMAVRWELLVDNMPAKRFYTMLGATISEKLIARWSVDAAWAMCNSFPRD
ncbi:GNAT family N-acetyltransferase [Microvirga lenta]|uniref:GNAT family N-acetyltransferase n=1 Tax=Microvirga lenta TaxID=2881337 RepID=UPI001CFF8D73|nr:GNAT family N-acetyltransferase [Microvirga lenta]MCB5175360.1 GNAT family N-acetyltransferase [Microvirga lenta]